MAQSRWSTWSLAGPLAAVGLGAWIALTFWPDDDAHGAPRVRDGWVEDIEPVPLAKADAVQRPLDVPRERGSPRYERPREGGGASSRIRAVAAPADAPAAPARPETLLAALDPEDRKLLPPTAAIEHTHGAATPPGPAPLGAAPPTEAGDAAEPPAAKADGPQLLPPRVEVMPQPSAGPRVRVRPRPAFAIHHDMGQPATPRNVETFLAPAPGSTRPSATGDDVKVIQYRRPPIDRPTESRPQPDPLGMPVEEAMLYRGPVDPPLGYAGPSGVLPREEQTDPRFVPMEDRWRIGFPAYDRYGKGHPGIDDYLYRPGSILDPFNQNVFKGDYPLLGQDIFLVVTATSRSIGEPRQVPTATTPFESTARPFGDNFFGKPNQLSYQQFFLLSFDLFRGDAAFRPLDWNVRLTPVFNINYLTVDELAVVNPDVRRGRARGRTFFALQEWFFEAKLADLGPNYDFVSTRLGSQFFNSDFRGFIFVDTNRAARLFGSRNSNREQFNLAYFDQMEKDTNSELNGWSQRNQRILIANYYIQDFIWPGYTAQASFHYNHDDPSFHFDKNDALVRPDPVGVAREHGLDVFYLGWAGDGHINRFNVNHAFYYAFGRDYLNPIANRGIDISAAMGALELSYDRDYVRFRTSVFWASGDQNPRNGTGCGFDAIFDNPNFAGGEFSYWQRQSIRLFGVNLVNRESLIPNLRSSKIQGQTNFVNPGLYLANLGMDIEITPRFRMINNVNFLWFDETAVLRQFTYANKIDQAIGTDLSMGFEYRPLLSNNVIIKFGVSSLLPSNGFYDLYNNLRDSVDPLVAGFVDVALTY